MKNSVYSSGIAASVLMLFGCLCKVMHWPGASILLILSVSVFCLLFLPMALKNSYENLQRYKTLHIIAFAVFFVCMLGVLFKVMHWPGAAVFMLLGILSPFLVFLPAYLYHTKDQTREGNINFSGLMFGMVFLAVFTAMLSLSPSRQIYDRAALGSYTKELAASLIKVSGNDEIAVKANEVNEFINSVKNEMIAAAEQTSHIDHRAAINPYELKFLDNRSGPREILLVNEEKMRELKKKISEFNNLVASGNCSEELKTLNKEILSVEDIVLPEEKGGNTIAWEQKTFINHELVFVLDALAQLQTNINIVAREYLANKKS